MPRLALSASNHNDLAAFPVHTEVRRAMIVNRRCRPHERCSSGAEPWPAAHVEGGAVASQAVCFGSPLEWKHGMPSRSADAGGSVKTGKVL
jgi:hypothetical protein